MKKRNISLHRNDSNTTPFVVVVAGRNGVTAFLYAPSWQKAKEKVDDAISSPLCAYAYARNEETGETYHP